MSRISSLLQKLEKAISNVKPVNVIYAFILCLVILALLPKIWWAKDLCIHRIQFTEEWYKGWLELLKIFLTFVIATYFWENHKKNKQLLEKIEQQRMINTLWNQTKETLIASMNNVEKSVNILDIDINEEVERIKYATETLFSICELAHNNIFILSILAKETIYFKSNIYPKVKKIQQSIEKKQILPGKKIPKDILTYIRFVKTYPLSFSEE
jgi:hypothetical protein